MCCMFLHFSRVSSRNGSSRNGSFRNVLNHVGVCVVVCVWWQGKDMAVTLSRKRRRSGQHVVLTCDDDNHDIGLSNFTDMGLQFLAEGCPRLEKLSLIWCSAVTSYGLIILAQACRGLKVLDMQVCRSPFYRHFLKKLFLFPVCA